MTLWDFPLDQYPKQNHPRKEPNSIQNREITPMWEDLMRIINYKNPQNINPATIKSGNGILIVASMIPQLFARLISICNKQWYYTLHFMVCLLSSRRSSDKDLRSHQNWWKNYYIFHIPLKNSRYLSGLLMERKCDLIWFRMMSHHAFVIFFGTSKNFIN